LTQITAGFMQEDSHERDIQIHTDQKRKRRM